MNDYIVVVVALIGGPLVAYLTSRASRPKVQAEAAKTYTDISLSLVEPQKRRIADLESKMSGCELRIKQLEDENNALHTWAQHLVAQVVEHGGAPVPFDSSFLPGGN